MRSGRSGDRPCRSSGIGRGPTPHRGGCCRRHARCEARAPHATQSRPGRSRTVIASPKNSMTAHESGATGRRRRNSLPRGADHCTSRVPSDLSPLFPSLQRRTPILILAPRTSTSNSPSEPTTTSASWSAASGKVPLMPIACMPAARAAARPADASSTTTQSAGGRPSSADARRYPSGSGFPRMLRLVLVLDTRGVITNVEIADRLKNRISVGRRGHRRLRYRMMKCEHKRAHQQDGTRHVPLPVHSPWSILWTGISRGVGPVCIRYLHAIVSHGVQDATAGIRAIGMGSASDDRSGLGARKPRAGARRSTASGTCTAWCTTARS